jgi:citrate lyase beta subunit
MPNHQAMGASLYVPSIHKDLLAIANGEKLPALRSLIFCTEDAVAERDLPYALSNLARTLRDMQREVLAARFVRVRNPEVLLQVLEMPGADKLAGFVIPKATRHNFGRYFDLVRHTHHQLMPTLETKEVFHDGEMQQFRMMLDVPAVRQRILALRIGGNDLLALLGLRRPRHMTIYKTPLGGVISRLVTTFRPYGFVLTAPVFEHLDTPQLLDEEVIEDLAHGMVGKTAIHPDQVALIERHYQVKPTDVEAARAILDAGSPAVFRLHDSMCEITTHRAWAQRTMEQASIFGQRHAGERVA